MIAALLRAMRGGRVGTRRMGEPDDDSPAFVRGLALGAFVGAAIAGSTLWRRFHAGPRGASDEPDPRIEASVTE